MTSVVLAFMDCRNTKYVVCVRRVEDYWEGYKLFCYAYYAHSMPHESLFRQTKLGL